MRRSEIVTKLLVYGHKSRYKAWLTVGPALMFLMLALPANASGESCERICTDNTGICFRISGSEAGEGFDVSMRKLHAALSKDQPFTIPADTMLHMFNMESDPCSRSETTVRNGKLKNTGQKTCVITYNSKIFGMPIDFRLEVPPTLSGTINKKEQIIIVSFPDASTSATLGVDNNPLQTMLQGRIARGEIYPSGFFADIALPAGLSTCLQVAFDHE
jgi:hypothetical protein